MGLLWIASNQIKRKFEAVRLIDFENLGNNDYVVTNQWVYPVMEGGRRFDIIMLVNGIPLVIGEAKTPVRPAVTWVDGASDIHNGYEQSVPQMFVPTVFSFAAEGKCYRYGSVRMPIDMWGPWHNGSAKDEVGRVKGGNLVVARVVNGNPRKLRSSSSHACESTRTIRSLSP